MTRRSEIKNFEGSGKLKKLQKYKLSGTHIYKQDAKKKKKKTLGVTGGFKFTFET